MIELLGHESADGDTADRRPPHAEMVEQGGEVGGEQVHGVGSLAHLGQSVPALVVGHQRELAHEPHDDVSPDTEIGAQRIDEHNCRAALGRPDHLVV